LPFGRHSVSALSIHGALVTQENGVPQEARFRIGGSETIRGQREEAFLATHAIWANLEWRYILGRRSRIFLFLDTGVLNDPAADGQRRLQMPFGFGGGIRATSGIGLLGLDYGLGKGDGPAQGKVHVRMVNEF
jgi:outer membrane protein insertion porin family